MGNLERVVPLRTGSSHGLDSAETRRDSGGSWLPLDEARRELGIPLSSLRRYLDRHGRYIPWTKSGKRVLVARSALPVLERIRRMYESGRTAAVVEDELGAAALLVAGEDFARVAGDGGDAARPSPRPSPPPPQTGSGNVTANGANLPAFPPPSAAAGPSIAAMQRQITALDRRLAEMQASIESRDLMIRQILSAMVHVIEAQDTDRRFAENERQIADDERDRQIAHQHQQVMLSLQEILNFTRRRRWFW